MGFATGFERDAGGTPGTAYDNSVVFSRSDVAPAGVEGRTPLVFREMSNIIGAAAEQSAPEPAAA